MLKRFYLDTSVWRDYFEDRSDGIRPLGEFASRFLQDCIACHCTLLYSETVLYELGRDYSAEKIRELFSPLAESLEFAEISKEQDREAKSLVPFKRPAHYADILHAILARDCKAIMIARDRHFDCLEDIVAVLKPEEVHFE